MLKYKIVLLLCACNDHIQNVTMTVDGKVACYNENWRTCLTIPVFCNNNLLNP
jgi:hypothetical protein